MYLQCIWIHESGYSLYCIYSYLEQRLNHCIYTACVCESLPRPSSLADCISHLGSRARERKHGRLRSLIGNVYNSLIPDE